jgi:hypothetical protein
MTHSAVARGPDAAIDLQINLQAAENDPLRDEAEAYGRKLDEPGVDVAATRHTGRSKVAIVTGASSGIGLEMVKRLIEKGLPRGCELPEHYVRYEPAEHCRSETGGRRHWY